MKKTILISGGTSGIGKASVIQLLKDGFNVSTFSTSQDKCDKLKEELSKDFDPEHFIVEKGNVTNEENMTMIVNKTLEKFNSIDILFNNAGFGYFAESDKVDLSRFQEMIQTNLFGLAMLTKLVIPQMKKQQSGLILNLASISGKVAYAQGEFYSATKFGVMGYSEGLRNELAGTGIKVSTICPGMVKTDFFGEKELARRKELNGGIDSKLLEVSDVTNIISLICNQSETSDIRDITIMPS